MRYLLSFLFVLASFSFVQAQSGPQFSWEQTSHNFGTIKEGEKATYDFEFTNTGNKPLLIHDVSVTCTCTKVDFPKAPIMPGKKGKINIIYDTKDKAYPFKKSLWVKSNIKDENGMRKRIELIFSGDVSN